MGEGNPNKNNLLTIPEGEKEGNKWAVMVKPGKEEGERKEQSFGGSQWKI